MIETTITISTITLCQIMTIIPLLLSVLTTGCFVFSIIAAYYNTVKAVVSSEHHH
ncbi:MAG: hypothetical protein J6X49_03385 [Victivallales bacterium]|nr:hypothetical protein [Victivallales bacterium]